MDIGCACLKSSLNPPIFEAIVFGIRLSIGTVGEQADNLEATARAAAYQDCHVCHVHCKLSHDQHARFRPRLL
jgi:hypothetical protein